MGIMVPEYYLEFTKSKRLELLNLYKDMADLPQQDIVEQIGRTFHLTYDQAEDFVQWRRKLEKVSMTFVECDKIIS